MPYAKNWLRIKLKGLDAIFLKKIETKIVVGSKAYSLCNWDISFHISFEGVDLSKMNLVNHFWENLWIFSRTRDGFE